MYRFLYYYYKCIINYVFIDYIHLDGVQARTPKFTQFNNGNMPYELQLRSSTIINTLGKYELKNNVQSEHVKFIDVGNTLNTCVSKEIFHHLIFNIIFLIYAYVYI